MEEFDKRLSAIEEKIDDIADNHLPSLYGMLDDVASRVRDLRWYIMIASGVLGVVLAMLQVFG